MSFDWNRKLLKYSLCGALKPDRFTPLVQGLSKAALDTRKGGRNDRHNVHVMMQYAVAVGFALNLDRVEAVLELGTGYSSLLWGTLKQDGTRVWSVDGKPLANYDIREPLEAVANKVDFVNGATLTNDHYRAFYDGQSKARFLGCPAAAIREHLDTFITAQPGPYAETLALPGDPHQLRKAVLERLFEGDSLRCLSQVLPEDCEADARFCSSAGPTALDHVLSQAKAFDAVFYDCGEFSTMVEWELTNHLIRPGGLAVFHDVYFPKSVKTFLICAALCASQEWDVLYRDATTPQGLFIARKK